MRTPSASVNWRAAAWLGLVSSTFSTLVSQLTAARIGRDAAVDWMVVATIPLREGVLQVEPSWGAILAGILFHQWADFSWVTVFFGLLGRWTASLRPGTLLVIAPVWALFTSALEWLVLVPLVPFWQPIFTLEQPYWIGLTVHATSASLYPLFPWLRDHVAGRPSHGRFAAAWGGLAATGALALGVVAFLGWQGRELPHRGVNAAFDQSFVRRMMAHHAQGIETALIGAERANDPHLRAVSRLMAAQQTGENRVFAQWWESWFSDASPVCSAAEAAAMPGMLSRDDITDLREAAAGDFDARFVQLMTVHHEGAIAMAEEVLREAGDPRLRLMAHAIRHEQRGEIELMRGREGWPAVRAAVAAPFRAVVGHIPTGTLAGAARLAYRPRRTGEEPGWPCSNRLTSRSRPPSAGRACRRRRSMQPSPRSARP